MPTFVKSCFVESCFVESCLDESYLDKPGIGLVMQGWRDVPLGR